MGTYTKAENTINGRRAWLYHISTPIGHIYVVDYEQSGLEIKRKIIDADYDKARRYFNKVCRQLLNSSADI